MLWFSGLWSDGLWSDGLWFGSGVEAADPVKGLPIKSPQTRVIDAKTIADRFNEGLPETPDYEFSRGRKFFQS